MFDNKRMKIAAIVGGILLVIIIISQLPPAFIEKFVPWSFTGAVFIFGINWVKNYKIKLDLRYPPAVLGAGAALHEKLLNEYSNYIIAYTGLIVMLFLGNLAGKTTVYFVGKTSLGTAQDAGIILTQKVANMTTGATTAIGTGVQTLVNGVTSYNVQLDPKDADFRQKYSLIPTSSGGSGGSSNSYSAPIELPAAQSVPVQSSAAPVEPEVTQPEQQSAAPPQQEVAQMQTVEYSVQPGDTLARLAVRYYGNADLWPLICAANAASLPGGCSNINSNQRLVIPPITADANVDLKQVAQQAMTQVNAAVSSGQMANNGMSQQPAHAVASSVPAGWSVVNDIVTREDYNTAIANSSQAGLPAQSAQDGSAVASWSVVKP